MTQEHIALSHCVLHYQQFPSHDLMSQNSPLTHRCFLALDGGAVEAQGGDTVSLPLDVEDALVVPLS